MNDTYLQEQSCIIIVVSVLIIIIIITKHISVICYNCTESPRPMIGHKFDNDSDFILYAFLVYWINSKKRTSYLQHSVFGA